MTSDATKDDYDIPLYYSLRAFKTVQSFLKIDFVIT